MNTEVNIRKTKVNILELKSILEKNLKIKKGPTRAIEATLEEYNNVRDENKCICVLTVWRYYKKFK